MMNYTQATAPTLSPEKFNDDNPSAQHHANVTPPRGHHHDVSPRSLRTSPQAVGSDEIKTLQSQGFTEGLAESLSDLRNSFALRIWVVDNSGSMMSADGHRIISTTYTTSSGRNEMMKIVDCTRWDEIKEAIMYHIEMCALLEAPTTFRLLNHPGIHATGSNTGLSQFEIGQQAGRDTIHQEVIDATDIMTKVRPGGATPLTRHMREIYGMVSSMKDILQKEGRRVAIIIATDGLPTDDYGTSSSTAREEFIHSLKRLQGFPVWLVIRLCTDDDEVVNFYNSLDDELELSIDVLDDFVSEAREVFQHNSWLNYALPLHRLREMGYHDRLFDMLDERVLSKGELRDFCILLFGIKRFDGVADPSEDWKGFVKNVEQLLMTEKLQYNPVCRKMTAWIDVKRLNTIYGKGGGCKCAIM